MTNHLRTPWDGWSFFVPTYKHGKAKSMSYPVMSPSEISQKIWADKYKAPEDKTVTDTWQRLADTSASVRVPKFIAMNKMELAKKL